MSCGSGALNMQCSCNLVPQLVLTVARSKIKIREALRSSKPVVYCGFQSRLNPFALKI